MLNTVLVPLDGSPLAEEALPYARSIVRPGGKIILITAVDLPTSLMYDVYPMIGVRVENPEGTNPYFYGAEKLITQAKAYSKRFVEEMTAAGFEVELVVEVSEPAALVIKAAQEEKVDAIVMSTHGRSGFTRWLFGSVTQKVLSAASCPVFVIPNKHRQQAEASLPETTRA